LKFLETKFGKRNARVAIIVLAVICEFALIALLWPRERQAAPPWLAGGSRFYSGPVVVSKPRLDVGLPLLVLVGGFIYFVAKTFPAKEAPAVRDLAPVGELRTYLFLVENGPYYKSHIRRMLTAADLDTAGGRNAVLKQLSKLIVPEDIVDSYGNAGSNKGFRESSHLARSVCHRLCETAGAGSLDEGLAEDASESGEPERKAAFRSSLGLIVIVLSAQPYEQAMFEPAAADLLWDLSVAAGFGPDPTSDLYFFFAPTGRSGLSRESGAALFEAVKAVDVRYEE
jgi:hypothetical protein